METWLYACMCTHVDSFAFLLTVLNCAGTLVL